MCVRGDNVYPAVTGAWLERATGSASRNPNSNTHSLRLCHCQLTAREWRMKHSLGVFATWQIDKLYHSSFDLACDTAARLWETRTHMRIKFHCAVENNPK